VARARALSLDIRGTGVGAKRMLVGGWGGAGEENEKKGKREGKTGDARGREHSRDERRMRRNEARSGTVGSTNGGTTTAKGEQAEARC